jgi:hypothetical protein
MWQWLKSNHQPVTAAAAIIVSVIALYVAWDQASVMRSQQHADVWPALQSDNQSLRNGETVEIGFRVKNAGVGPAMVRQVVIRHTDSGAAADFAEFSRNFPEGFSLSNETLTGRILAAGDTATPVQMRWNTSELDAETIDVIWEEIRNWSITTCYCSVLDDCWVATSRGYGQPREVDRCDIPDARQF